MKKLLLLILFSSYLNVYSQVYNAGTAFSGYYDITPDTLLNYTTVPYTNETYGINLFDDTSIDIELTAHGAGSSGGSDAYITVTSLNPNVYMLFGRVDSVYVIGSSNWSVTKVAKPLNSGDSINAANSIWDNSMLFLTDHSGHNGGNKNVNDWVGGDKYLGIKYQNGSTINYSWIRLQCIAEDSCYVKDFSYSSTVLVTQYTVSVSASPSIGGSISGGGTYNSGTSVTATATANSGYSFTNWTESGNVVSLSSNYTYTVTGNRTLIANFSQATSIYKLPEDKTSMIIYPNPTKGKIQIINNNSFTIGIEIYNLIGEKIYSRTNNKPGTYDIDISNSPKGIYIVKIDDGEKIYNKKIIVQ